MSLILNIDTSLETANISIAKDGVVLHTVSNTNQKDHAGFIHQAISNVLQQASVELHSLSAIAVIYGPGSYTGLRVGMASAKGLCFALNKPLITIGTLNMLTNACLKQVNSAGLYFPLIDARRMEVFTACFDQNQIELLAATAMILDEHSFSEQLKTNKIYFFGNGAEKLKSIISDKNAVFIKLNGLTDSFSELSEKKYLTNDFTHLIDSEPFYIKEFQSSPDKNLHK